MKNVLFVNWGGIGDEILFLPTIKSFKDKFPDSKITLALEPRSKSIKDLSFLIDDIVCVDIKASGFRKYFNILKFIISNWFSRFDCVISSGKTPFVAVILFLSFIKKRVGYKSKTDFLLTDAVKLNEDQYAAKMYHDLLKPFGISDYDNPKIDIKSRFSLKKIDSRLEKNNYIAIHPGVSSMSVSKGIFKCPEIKFWKLLITGILDKNKKIVLLGTKDDKELIDKILKIKSIKNNSNFINFYNKTKNISQMAYIMKNAQSVICVDSAPLHVAVSVGVPVYAIFGPTNEFKLVPKKHNVHIICKDIACRPCLWDKRKQNCDKSSCLNIDFNLILDNIC